MGESWRQAVDEAGLGWFVLKDILYECRSGWGLGRNIEADAFIPGATTGD